MQAHKLRRARAYQNDLGLIKLLLHLHDLIRLLGILVFTKVLGKLRPANFLELCSSTSRLPCPRNIDLVLVLGMIFQPLVCHLVQKAERHADGILFVGDHDRAELACRHAVDMEGVALFANGLTLARRSPVADSLAEEVQEFADTVEREEEAARKVRVSIVHMLYRVIPCMSADRLILPSLIRMGDSSEDAVTK